MNGLAAYRPPDGFDSENIRGMSVKTIEKSDIIAKYSMAGSIKRTASELNVSHSTVRRVLIEAGLYTSQRAEDVCRLREKGLSPDQIAESLKITRNAVMAYLPYNRGYQLGRNKSVNALRIRACRERKKANAKKAVDSINGTAIPQPITPDGV